MGKSTSQDPQRPSAPKTTYYYLGRGVKLVPPGRLCSRRGVHAPASGLRGHAWGPGLQVLVGQREVREEAGESWEATEVPQLERHWRSMTLKEKRCSSIQLSCREWEVLSTSLPPKVRQASSTTCLVGHVPSALITYSVWTPFESLEYGFTCRSRNAPHFRGMFDQFGGTNPGEKG